MTKIFKKILSAMIVISIVATDIMPAMASNVTNSEIEHNQSDTNNSVSESNQQDVMIEDISVGGQYGELINNTLQNSGEDLQTDTVEVTKGDQALINTLKNSVASDYEEFGTDRMEVLDDEGEKFVVYNEGVVRISSTESELVGVEWSGEGDADVELKFKNPTSEMLELEQGTVIEINVKYDITLIGAPRYGKVSYKETDVLGNLIIGIDTKIEMEEVFAYAKIESNPNSDEEEEIEVSKKGSLHIQPPNNPDVGMDIGNLNVYTKSEDGYNYYGVTYSSGGDDDEGGDEPSGGASSEVEKGLEVTAEIAFDFDCDVYINMGAVDISVEIGYIVNSEVKLGIEAELSVKICEVKITAAKVLNITFTPTFVMGVSGEITFEGSLEEGKVGFKYKDGEFTNLSKKPKLKTSLSVDVSFEIGMDFELGINLVSSSAVEMKGTMSIRLKVEGTLFSIDSEEAENAIHLCNHCIEGNIIVDLSFEVGFTIFGVEIEEEMEEPFELYKGEWYSSSLDGYKFITGECPHILYKTNLYTTKKAIGKPKGNVQVKVTLPKPADESIHYDIPKDAQKNDVQLDSNNSFSFKTGSDGCAVYYLAKGQYSTIQTDTNWEGDSTFSIEPDGEELEEEEVKKAYLPLVMKESMEILSDGFEVIKTIDGKVYIEHEDGTISRVVDSECKPILAQKLYLYDGEIAILDEQGILWKYCDDTSIWPTDRKYYFTKEAENVKNVLEISNSNNDCFTHIYNAKELREEGCSNYYVSEDGKLYSPEGIITGIEDPLEYYTTTDEDYYSYFIAGNNNQLYRVANGTTQAEKITGIEDVAIMKNGIFVTSDSDIYYEVPKESKYAGQKKFDINKVDMEEWEAGKITDIVSANISDYQGDIICSNDYGEIQWISFGITDRKCSLVKIICVNGADYASGLALSFDVDAEIVKLYNYSYLRVMFDEWELLVNYTLDGLVYAMNYSYYDDSIIEYKKGALHAVMDDGVYVLEDTTFQQPTLVPNVIEPGTLEKKKLYALDTYSDPYLISASGRYVVDDEQNVYRLGEKISFENVSQVKTTDLSQCTITPISNQVYSYKNKYNTEFTITKPNGSVLKENIDYTVSIGDMSKAGNVTVEIVGIGDCKGTVYNNFEIIPKHVTTDDFKFSIKFKDGFSLADYIDENDIIMPIDDENLNIYPIKEVDYTVVYPLPDDSETDYLVLGVDYDITNRGFAKSPDGREDWYYYSMEFTFKGNYTGKMLCYSDYICIPVSEHKDYYISRTDDGGGWCITGGFESGVFGRIVENRARQIVWSTSDPYIMDIDENGVPTTYGSGFVTIYADFLYNYGLSTGHLEYITYVGDRSLLETNVIAETDGEKFSLSWETRDTALRYEIYRDGELVATIDNAVNTITWTDTAKLKAGSYYYYVKTVYPGYVYSYTDWYYRNIEKDMQEDVEDKEQSTEDKEQSTEDKEQSTEDKEQSTENKDTEVNKPAQVTNKVAKTNVTKIENISNGLKISWKKIKNVSGYVIYRSENGKSAKRYKEIKKPSVVSYKDISVKSGVKYTYYVLAYKKVGNKNIYSKKGTSKSKYYLSAPKIKSVVRKKSNTMTVNWSKIKGASGYQIKYVVGNKTRTVTVVKASVSKKVIKLLKKNKQYKVYIRSYKKVGKTKYYSVWSRAKKIK